MVLSDLGTVLKNARKQRKLTLQELSAQTGVHYTTLSELERGRMTEFGVRKLMRVAATLGLELNLRPTGQPYTLDDVASERRNQTLQEANTSKNELAKLMNAHKDASAQFSSENQLAKLMKVHNDATAQLGSKNELAKLMKAHKDATVQLGSANELARQLNSKNNLLDRVLGENWARPKKAT